MRAILAPLVVLAASCGSPIFEANFDGNESRTVDPIPPGGPAGDYIMAPPPSRVQVGTAPTGLTGRALFYTAVNLAWHFELTPEPIEFISSRVSDDSVMYYATWKAVRRYTGGNAELDIYLLDQSDNELVHLVLYASGYYLVSPQGGWRRIGVIQTNVAHQVAVALDPRARTFSVGVSGREVGSISDVPLPADFNVRTLTLKLEYSSFGSTSYIVDDVLMTEECLDEAGERGPCD